VKAYQKIRVAVIGAGYMAHEHLRAFDDCSGVQLVGVHSRSPKRIAKITEKYPFIQIASSINELWEKTRPDLVIIAVPILACVEVCKEAFKYRWTLLIEKPVGHNLEEAKQIEAEAQTLNAKAYVALNRRFYGSTLRLQKYLEHNDEVRLINILDQEDTIEALAAGQPVEVVKNWMYANSIHLIDYFNQLCRGELVNTKVLSPWRPELPGPVLAQLSFSSGDIGLYQAAWNAPGPWSVTVSTQQFRGELRPIEQLGVQKAGERHLKQEATDSIDQDFKPGLRRQADAAICAVQGKEHKLPTIAEANKSMNIVEAIYGM
tara:strand:+ start:13435 stop:14388 length:954 start_codon:yes stop_codon:yes gene_type:complete